MVRKFEKHLKTMGIDGFQSQEELKSIYREKAKQYHPDNLDTGDVSKFLAVKEAFNALRGMKSCSIRKLHVHHKSLFNVEREMV